MVINRYFLFILFVISGVLALAQEKATIYGAIKDDKDVPLEFVNISVIGTTIGTTTNKNGMYELVVPAGKEIKLGFSFVGYKKDSAYMRLRNGERRLVNRSLELVVTNIKPFEYIDKNEKIGISRIEIKEADLIPTTSGGEIEQLVKVMGMGVYSNNELSSQYSVRGGNFDENLVYVNDIEIYRPFLNRAGEQEGLSFINSDLTANVEFSSGGFDARYGDKMSSVLDIQYKRPKKFRGSVMLSLLGVAAHVEGATKNQKFTYLIGVRQKSNAYLLSALQTKGQYKPSFTDVQANLTYKFSEKWEISLLGNYARNKYLVIPETRETTFGTVKESYKLQIYFDGNETDKITTYLGALSTTYQPSTNLKLKLIASAFQTSENDTYDIQGQYWIGKLENNMGNENYGEMKEIIGVGTQLDHARDKLYATVGSLDHKGAYSMKKHYIMWGAGYQIQFVDDQLKEWQMIDSSGYTLPHPIDSVGYLNPALQQDKPLFLQNVISSKISMTSSRATAYLQDTWELLDDSVKLSLTYGVRACYWDYNKQFLVSPRLTLTLKPKWKNDIAFRFSTGYYYQPPFYKELRDFNGELNKDIKAQTSIHFVLGSEWNFMAWERPFKFVAEGYYKYLYNIIPYEVENIQIKYYAKNNAHGYATGLDMKIHGEFARDAESWFGLSLMQTREDIEGDFYYNYYNKEGELIITGYTQDQVKFDSVRVEPGFIPRPTDQLLNVNLFFQDYIPKLPMLRMHLNLVYGTPLPFGPPSHERYKDTLRMPAYFRVDIGFSWDILNESSILPKRNPFHIFRSLILSAEVFNLLGRLNTISYYWVKDVNGRTYAVPNELTNRLFNIKLIAKF